MQPRIIFIASLSHSGSTLLDLLLGAHPNFVGLGELYKVLQMSPAQLESEKVMRCTCGQHVADCVFWNPTLSALQKQADSSLAKKYLTVLDCLQNIMGKEKQLVDSSKYLAPLHLVTGLPGVDLKTIHLLKDVRSFTVSQRDSLGAELKYHHLPILGSLVLSRMVYQNSLKSPIYLYWKWYLRNQALQRHLKNAESTHVQVGYDELAQSPEDILPKLFKFLGTKPPQAANFLPKQTNSHIFMGNPMIASPQKMSGIYYDDRWKSRRDWKLPHVLFPGIRAYNKKAVYSNIAKTEDAGGTF
jgi:hypothetical protein